MANRPVKSDPKNNLTKEHLRLAEAYAGPVAPWRKWGPYVSERSWGAVREDYSESGNAWDYFTHDMARSKTYRWGEDGIAGICDRYQVLVFALALWNGRDPILKERMFGLSCNEGNHGEDVQGILVVSRQHADAQLYADALQVSAAGVSVRVIGGGKRAPMGQFGGLSMNCWIPEFSTTTVTGMCSSSMRRRMRRICASGSKRSTAGRKPRNCICCRTCGFGIRGRGRIRERASHESCWPTVPMAWL